MKQAKNCANMNHSQSNSPIKYCPMCGEKFNSSVSPKSCSEAVHAARRKERSAYCHDCGKKLIETR